VSTAESEEPYLGAHSGKLRRFRSNSVFEALRIEVELPLVLRVFAESNKVERLRSMCPTEFRDSGKFGCKRFLTHLLPQLQYRVSDTSHFRQGFASKLHFRQFNGSKHESQTKVEMRNLRVLFVLAAINWFQSRQLIDSKSRGSLLVPIFQKKYKELLNHF
jgi:hypothetical protein